MKMLTFFLFVICFFLFCHRHVTILKELELLLSVVDILIEALKTLARYPGCSKAFFLVKLWLTSIAALPLLIVALLWKKTLRHPGYLYAWLGGRSFISYLELIIPLLKLTFIRSWTALCLCYQMDEETGHVALIFHTIVWKMLIFWKREDTCMHDWVGKVLSDTLNW